MPRRVLVSSRMSNTLALPSRPGVARRAQPLIEETYSSRYSVHVIPCGFVPPLALCHHTCIACTPRLFVPAPLSRRGRAASPSTCGLGSVVRSLEPLSAPSVWARVLIGALPPHIPPTRSASLVPRRAHTRGTAKQSSISPGPGPEPVINARCNSDPSLTAPSAFASL